MRKLIIQTTVYLVLAALLAELLVWELRAPLVQRPYSERGYVELAQTLMLVGIVLMLSVRWRSSRGYRELSGCMALVFLVFLIRENDHFLDVWLTHGAWKYIAILPMVYGGYYFLKERSAVMRQVVSCSDSASYGLLVAGLVVLVYSRMFGRSSYWKEVMGEDYLRIVKNAAEEGVEQLAFAILLLAVWQYFRLPAHHDQPPTD